MKPLSEKLLARAFTTIPPSWRHFSSSLRAERQEPSGIKVTNLRTQRSALAGKAVIVSSVAAALPGITKLVPLGPNVTSDVVAVPSRSKQGEYRLSAREPHLHGLQVSPGARVGDHTVTTINGDGDLSLDNGSVIKCVPPLFSHNLSVFNDPDDQGVYPAVLRVDSIAEPSLGEEHRMSFKPAVKPNHPGVLTQKISGAGSREHTQEVMVGKLWPGTNDTSILAQFRSPAIAAREANLVALLRASDLIKQAALGTKVPDELIYHCLYQAQASGQEAHPQVYDLEAVLRSVVGALGPFFGRKEQTLSHLHIAQAITGARGLSTRLATESDVKLALQNIRKSWPSKVRYQVAPGSVFFKLR